jgi:hypothetical protein
MIVRCTNHCGACGRHFHSLRAFDKHRLTSTRTGKRRCMDPADRGDVDGHALYSVLTEDGLCKLSHGPAQHGVTIWTLRAAPEGQISPKSAPKRKPKRPKRRNRARGVPRGL